MKPKASDGQQGATPQAAERSKIVWTLNEPTSHLIYSFLTFMVSVATFKSSAIQHDAHLVHHSPI